MPKIKKLSVKDYMTDRWDIEEFKKTITRLGGEGSKEFAMGWLTAHAIVDSNYIEITDPLNYSQEIAKGVRGWVTEHF